MATAAELRAQAAAARDRADEADRMAEELAAEARKVEREEAAAKMAAENKAHYERMYTEIGQPAGLNEAQHGIVYAQAWEQGHSSGFGEVESYYGEFAEMARKLLDAR
jgi:predicted nucleic acid-binding protein